MGYVCPNSFETLHRPISIFYVGLFPETRGEVFQILEQSLLPRRMWTLSRDDVLTKSKYDI
jgi:hypothetical protein